MKDNLLKYENYKAQKVRLKKAISQEFYIEAIAIEYSIFEDRSESALRHAGIQTVGSKGNAVTFSRKLNKLKTHGIFSEKVIRSKMPTELIDQIQIWKAKRDELMHALLNLKISTEQFREAAEEGQELVRLFDNKVSCLNRYFIKRNNQ